MTQSRSILPKWFQFLIIAILVLGIFFRFVNLDHKVYWYDEAYTSIRISGYSLTEIQKQAFNGKEIGVKDLQKYKQPNSEKGLVDTLKGLADDVHTPLYFIMGRFWMQLFGNSVAVIRSLSVFISLLAFPCIYWLCLELFNSSATGWIAIALIAISPFHLIYAQEARPYSLWIVTILFSSASLLKALRGKNKLNWSIYAASVALGIYSHIFFLLVVISHGIYVAVTEGIRESKTFTSYRLASYAGFITFFPWLLVITLNLRRFLGQSAWTSHGKLTSFSLINKWIENFTVVFMNTDINGNIIYFGFSELLTDILKIILIIMLLTLGGYSFYFLYRNTEPKTYLFIFLLIGIPFLILGLPDLLFGGVRSTIGRFVTPSWLGIQLAISYLFADKISSMSVKKRDKLWYIVVISLVLIGVISCGIISQSETWSGKGMNYKDKQLAHTIKQAETPLIISDAVRPNSIGKIISFSYLLDSKVRLQILPVPYIEQINFDNFSKVFLYNKPSRKLREKLNKKYQIKSIFLDKYLELWELERKE
ncbi:MAG: hypothetical protein F6K10_38690 [Moorea sp. SIO2B7]|nr:hypothetical protein [Moorena sp. SIO2B7]